MFKKKCNGNEDDWTPSARGLVCDAIHWHRNPNYAKTCWREEAYELIDEAEKHMLDGTFDQWAPSRAILRSTKWKVRELEVWGASVLKRMEGDRLADEEKSKKLRKADFHSWCMVCVSCLIEGGRFG
jgi:hypothetical protein